MNAVKINRKTREKTFFECDKLPRLRGYIVAEVKTCGCWITANRPNQEGYVRIAGKCNEDRAMVHVATKVLLHKDEVAAALQDPALIRFVDQYSKLPLGWHGHHIEGVCSGKACCNPDHIQVITLLGHGEEHNDTRIAAIREKRAQYPKFADQYRRVVLEEKRLPSLDEMMGWGMTLDVARKAQPIWNRELGVKGGRSGRLDLEADLAPAKERCLSDMAAGKKPTSCGILSEMTGVPEGTIYTYRKMWIAEAKNNR